MHVAHMDESHHTSNTPFRAPLRVELFCASLPLLGRVLSYLEEAHGFDTNEFERIYIKFVSLLSKVIHAAVHIVDEGVNSRFNDEADNFTNQYNSFIRASRTARSSITTPVFDDLWLELVDTCTHIHSPRTTYKALLCNQVVVHGKKVKGHQALAFEYTQHCSAKYTPLIHAIFDKQPVHQDLPSNFPNLIYQNRLHRNTPDEEFFVLHMALFPFASNTGADSWVQDIIVHFGMLVAYTVDLFVATSYTPSVAQTGVLLETAFEAWDMVTSDIFGSTPLPVRRQMVLLNVRGITEALVHKCRQLLREHRSSATLGWRLNAWFFANVASALQRCGWPPDLARHLVVAASDLEFGTGAVVSDREDFVLRGYRRFGLDRDRLVGVDQFDRLEDVRLVPDGEARDPRKYTDAILVYDKKGLCVVCQYEFGDDPVVELRSCAHVLHLECVRIMINGGGPSSNLCPLCREVICPRRPRKPR